MNHSIFLRHFVSWAKLFYKIFKPIGIRQGFKIQNHQVAVCGNNSIYSTPQLFLRAQISY
ncbi:hypothetical protein [Flavobacterium frigoritolerans]|jgi:hypothetical protein|uniref:hypothetical protein n=1 Tax=Flavobacterium frigoritolerans TaxID=2987686 RepID=UPI0021F779A4|nr:hypothetical protein [Flavobacterium frigoritolerans]